MITFLMATLIPFTHAALIEVGGSANYRASNYDKTNYLRSTSYTASLSYYFWEMCALEANYTSGYAQQLSKGPSVTDSLVKLQDLSQFVSFDVVMSAAERDDLIRPYLKLGGGYLQKDRYRRIDQNETEKLGTQRGWVPSAGLGLAIGLSRALSLKLGVDAWTSPLGHDKVSTIDYAGRAGASWIF